MVLLDRIVEEVARGLELAESRLMLEQAVRGLDMLDELRLHAVIAESLSACGWGVLREVPYPTPPSRRARRAERDRCDIVLTPRAGQRLRDSVELAREEDERNATLFAGVASDASGPAQLKDAAIDPRDAVWIEVKTTGQFTCRSGIGGPNQTYARDLVGGPSLDVRKLGSDPAIVHGIAIVAMFAADVRVARHDLTAAAHRMLSAGTPLASHAVCAFPIVDRIGNSTCVVAGFGAIPTC